MKYFILLLLTGSIHVKAQVKDSLEYDVVAGYKTIRPSLSNFISLADFSLNDLQLAMQKAGYESRGVSNNCDLFAVGSTVIEGLFSIERCQGFTIWIWSTTNHINKNSPLRDFVSLMEKYFYKTDDALKANVYALNVKDSTYYFYVSRRPGFEACKIVKKRN